MHILLFNEYYPPDTSATAKMAVQVAEALARRHQVTVVAGRPSYDPDARYPSANALASGRCSICRIAVSARSICFACSVTLSCPVVLPALFFFIQIAAYRRRGISAPVVWQ